jgi:prepilin-type N-terminal cleavage/methylation domain-containing protein
MRTGTRGFTLIEIMIVVAVIAVIAAIAIPNLIQSRVRANEAAAIENLRVISAAQFSYHAAKATFGGFAELASEVDGAGTGFLDPSWHEGVVKTGYAFTLAAANADAFECYADPVLPGSSGVRFFRVDASGIVRFSHTARPDASAPAIGQ